MIFQEEHMKDGLNREAAETSSYATVAFSLAGDMPMPWQAIYYALGM